MFILAHLGIGKKIASPWSRSLPLVPLLIGTLLPDIIDKSTFYGLRILDSFDVFKPFADSGLQVISGTRTFGHTAILLFAVLILSGVRKSPVLAALALGMATHLLIDNFSDHLHDAVTGAAHDHSAAIALLWPFLNSKFASYPFASATEHLSSVARPELLIGELTGFLLLSWDYWKSARSKELTKLFLSRRYRLFKRHRFERD
jgi:hypothetical protein